MCVLNLNNKIHILFCKKGKYTLWSFLPKGIFEQFRRVANVYFLIISVLMAVGTYVENTWYSSLDPWTTIGPLMLIVGLTLMKEGFEDSKRHKADHAVRIHTSILFFFFFLIHHNNMLWFKVTALSSLSYISDNKSTSFLSSNPYVPQPPSLYIPYTHQHTYHYLLR